MLVLRKAWDLSQFFTIISLSIPHMKHKEVYISLNKVLTSVKSPDDVSIWFRPSLEKEDISSMSSVCSKGDYWFSTMDMLKQKYKKKSTSLG